MRLAEGAVKRALAFGLYASGAVAPTIRASEPKRALEIVR
jgi:hypothetical protein